MTDIVTPTGAWAPKDDGGWTPSRATPAVDATRISALESAVATLTTNLNQVAPRIGFKNRLINCDLAVWQRGTSFSPAANTSAYCADRWVYATGIGSTVTYAKDNFGIGTTVDRYTATIDWGRTVAGTSDASLGQRMEDVRTLQTQVVTFSWFMFTISGSVDVVPYIAQNFGTGGSAQVVTSGPTYTATGSTFTQFTWTVTVPSISGKTVGANSYLEVGIIRQWNTTNALGTVRFYLPQFEAGSTASSFDLRPQAVEWALCRRYFKRFLFQRWPVNGVAPISINAHFPCDDMRTTPSVTLGGGAAWNDASFSNGVPPGANAWGLVLESAAWVTRTGTLALSTSVDASSAKIAITGAATMSNLPSDLATDGSTMWVDLSAEL